MIYSVWHPGRSVYDYYETAEQTVRNPDPRIGGRGGALGVPSTDAGWHLPSGARPAGSGKEAKGMVATRNGGALGGFSLGGVGLGGLALGALGLWLVMRRK